MPAKKAKATEVQHGKVKVKDKANVKQVAKDRSGKTPDSAQAKEPKAKNKMEPQAASPAKPDSEQKVTFQLASSGNPDRTQKVALQSQSPAKQGRQPGSPGRSDKDQKPGSPVRQDKDQKPGSPDWPDQDQKPASPGRQGKVVDNGESDEEKKKWAGPALVKVRDATAAAAAPAAAAKTGSAVRELKEESEFLLLLKRTLAGSGNFGGVALGLRRPSAGSPNSLGSSKRRAPRMLLVCFTADWCRPCLVFQPKLELLARRYCRVKFAKINVDKLPDIADKYNVKAVPTFVLFKGGSQVGAVAAASQPKIEELLFSNGAVAFPDDGPSPVEAEGGKKARGV